MQKQTPVVKADPARWEIARPTGLVPRPDRADHSSDAADRSAWLD